MKILRKSNCERRGIIATKNGDIKTPFFMPDATRGFIKSLGKDDLEKNGAGPLVVNTYHLYLEPGIELIKKAGGIHKFMNWNGPLLSDSGGYQIFSLIHKNPRLGKITDKEAIFRSPIDGSLHKITPEKSIEIQFDLGVDMMVVLDDPPPNDYPREKIEKAVKRTLEWAKRCKIEYDRQIKKRKIIQKERPLIFGVIQGGRYSDLRKKCAESLVEIGFDGYGFGARHIDDDGNFMEEVVRETAQLIPENSIRFALGVGTPEDILRFHNFGWDIFDCVIPTREGRHGRLFLRKKDFILIPVSYDDVNTEKQSCAGEINSKIATSTSDSRKNKLFYETININNEKHRDDFSTIDRNCDCELCKNYTRAYLRHLFCSRDPLAMRLASIHNLKFYFDFMEKLREADK